MVQNTEADCPRRGRGRPQLRADDDTRSHIIEAAEQEFQANGYAATCIAKVAERACVSTKTLYRLIPTKAELFRSVVSDRISLFVLESHLDGLDSLDAAEALERILNAFGIVFASRPRAYLRMASDAFIENALGLKKRDVLFGRRNTLLDEWDRPLAEIVEILPP